MGFEPSLVHGSTTTMSPFRFWCQKVLPLVYDNSLSYYELLCKVVEYLNETMENVNTIGENTNALYQSYLQLVEYVNTYLSDENLQGLIDNTLDRLASEGKLSLLMRYDAGTERLDFALNTQAGDFSGETLETDVYNSTTESLTIY